MAARRLVSEGGGREEARACGVARRYFRSVERSGGERGGGGGGAAGNGGGRGGGRGSAEGRCAARCGAGPCRRSSRCDGARPALLRSPVSRGSPCTSEALMAGAGVKAVLSAGDAGIRRAEPRGAAAGWSVGRSVCRSVCRSVGRSVGGRWVRGVPPGAAPSLEAAPQAADGAEISPWSAGSAVARAGGEQSHGVPGSSAVTWVDPKSRGVGVINGQSSGSQIMGCWVHRGPMQWIPNQTAVGSPMAKPIGANTCGVPRSLMARSQTHGVLGFPMAKPMAPNTCGDLGSLMARSPT